MSQFIVRIELHDASLVDYDVLHKAMGTAGFLRVIKSDVGVWYNLPWAEYNIISNVARGVILSSAKIAVAKTGHLAGLLVSEIIGCSWDGLSVVK